jgi:hypothetical protein
VAYDYFIEVITQLSSKANRQDLQDLPWVCMIVNTAPKTSSGMHRNLAMWRLYRNRIQVTLWEPYSHNKYSAHIKAALEESFPTGTIYSFTTGA